MDDYIRRYNDWCTNDYFDEDTKAELRRIADDEKEIKERFYKNLTFGTAGLRGIIGAGTNRMNIYSVRKATQGLANYIISLGEKKRGVAICYDSRHMSREFAKETALCLAANGIKAYVFDDLRPTPELSFAVRELGCIAGVTITASHNPPEYNGYKVYWEDGAQITTPHDKGIMAEVQNVENETAVKTMSHEDAVASGLYVLIGQAIDDAYISKLKELVLRQDAIRAESKNLKIVYTPLHGSGNVLARRILKELGFEQVYVVKEQEFPDGDFPTVPSPNPEVEGAFTLALELAKEVDADFILATDPDADRIGVRVKDEEGIYHDFTGNMSGALLAEYELSQLKELGRIPKDGYLLKSIVTTNLGNAIAKSYGVGCKESLTGFKYIGKQMRVFEETGEGTFVFGFEESYGSLLGTYARDKDAVAATMAICEAAAYYRTKGMSLWDAMIAMYEKYGYYKEGVKSFTMKGIEGLEKIQNIIQSLRKEPPSEVGEYKVEKIRDYKNGEIKDLPKANVLYYELSDDAWIAIRPSGTEPKIKFYYGIKGTSLADADAKAADIGKEVLAMVENVLDKG